MTYYQKIIIEDTGCSPAEALSLEEIMRCDIFHSTLDWQTRTQLRRAARQAAGVLKVLQAENT